MRKSPEERPVHAQQPRQKLSKAGPSRSKKANKKTESTRGWPVHFLWRLAGPSVSTTTVVSTQTSETFAAHGVSTLTPHVLKPTLRAFSRMCPHMSAKRVCLPRGQLGAPGTHRCQPPAPGLCPRRRPHGWGWRATEGRKRPKPHLGPLRPKKCNGVTCGRQPVK